MDEAIKHYKRGIILKPDFYEAYTNLCSAYTQKGWFDLALQQCDMAVQIFQDYSVAHGLKGAIYGNIGALDEAIKEFQIAVKLDPDNSTFCANLEKAYHLKKSAEKSEIRRRK